MAIKNIIFDLGGVILNINTSKTLESFAEIGIENPTHLMHQVVSSGLFFDFEKGLISEDNFRDQMNKASGKTLHVAQFDKAWNAMLLNYPMERIEWLKKLSSKYNLYLLSNTNIIHYRHYNTLLAKLLNNNGLPSLFKKVYLSHEMGIRKPNTKIFETVLTDAKIVANHTLFVEDTEENLIWAAKLGINTCLIKQNSNYYEATEFKNYLGLE